MSCLCGDSAGASGSLGVACGASTPLSALDSLLYGLGSGCLGPCGGTNAAVLQQLPVVVFCRRSGALQAAGIGRQCLLSEKQEVRGIPRGHASGE
jgi:hypothetical protein